MLIGIDSSPCSFSLRNRSTLCSTTKCHQNKLDLKNEFVQKIFFFNIFYSFNPNHAYWNQRRLFSGSLPGMFSVSIPMFVKRVIGGFFPAVCRLCYSIFWSKQYELYYHVLFSVSVENSAARSFVFNNRFLTAQLS